MHIFRPAAVAVLASCALASSASADPAISVSATPFGALETLPARVDHRLTLTAGASAETVTVTGPGLLRVSGTAPERESAVPFALIACEGRWLRQHIAYRGTTGRSEVTLTIAPSSTVFVETSVVFARAPWAQDTLEASFEVTPASGVARTVASPAPAYGGPRGLEITFKATRRGVQLYDFTGSVGLPRVNSGDVFLEGYAPGRKRATRLALAGVHGGRFKISNLRLPRPGRWEFFVRYRTESKAYANDVTQCGTVVRVR
jgi:hypothetical protein